MENVVFAVIVAGGAFLGARYGMSFQSTAEWTLGALLLAAVVRAILIGPFPKQFWGPGTIGPRDTRRKQGQDNVTN